MKPPSAILTIAGSAKMPAPIVLLRMLSANPGKPITRFKPSFVFVLPIFQWF